MSAAKMAEWIFSGAVESAGDGNFEPSIGLSNPRPPDLSHSRQVMSPALWHLMRGLARLSHPGKIDGKARAAKRVA